MRNRIVRIPEDVYQNIAYALNNYREEGIDKVILELILIGIKEKDFRARTQHEYLSKVLKDYGDKNEAGKKV